jgi:hypothetical protein
VIAEDLAERLIPIRRHPHGAGWGTGELEQPQQEGFAIRKEVERTTTEIIQSIIEQE